MKRFITLSLLLFVLVSASLAQSKRILVFSKTKGWRHSSIPNGIKFFQELGVAKGFAVDTTENATKINEENLKQYNAVVFMNTTGDILTDKQQADFERYIQAGGGYVGVHSATDTEYKWEWYNGLAGAYFMSHPGPPNNNVQNGKFTTMDTKFKASAHLPATFERKDEFYDFKSLKKDDLHFLVSLDETSYKGGKMGEFHPIAWYHEYDGGKAFYSSFGHVDDTFKEPLMAEHFWKGLEWAMAKKLKYKNAHSARVQ